MGRYMEEIRCGRLVLLVDHAYRLIYRWAVLGVALRMAARYGRCLVTLCEREIAQELVVVASLLLP